MKSIEPPPIRLVVLDDHDAGRARLVARLATSPRLVTVIGDAAQPEEALELVQELRPDAVLVETRREDAGGLEAIARLAALDGATRPLIVAHLEILQRDVWPAAHAAGADDLLLSELTPQALAQEIVAIIERADKRTAHPTVADRELPAAARGSRRES